MIDDNVLLGTRESHGGKVRKKNDIGNSKKDGCTIEITKEGYKRKRRKTGNIYKDSNKTWTQNQRKEFKRKTERSIRFKNKIMGSTIIFKQVEEGEKAI